MRLDIERYKARSNRLDLTGLDFDSFRAEPLAPEVLRSLQYMHDVEHHTICYLRDLLVTSAHADPDITAFLACWVFEELWHGEAIGAVLLAHDLDANAPRVGALRARIRRGDRFSPLIHGVGSALAGESFLGIHMAWGALKEWTTQAGYARLSVLAGHPTLSDLLGRIMRQEGRHIDFYAGEAERRLSDDPRARRLARFALRRFWKPVGSGVMPRSEVDFLVNYLFSGDDGAAIAARIDRRVDRLPGLEGLRLVEQAVGSIRSTKPLSAPPKLAAA